MDKPISYYAFQMLYWTGIRVGELLALTAGDFDFENGTAEIVRFADWDTMKTNRFANKAIAYLMKCENEKLPKETMVAFEI